MNGIIGGGLLVWIVYALPVMGQSTASYVGTESCLERHEDNAESFARNVHGRLSDYQYPGEGHGCESCHGPGAAHVESNEPSDIVRFTVDAGEPATEICMSCHRTGTTFNWLLGPHASNDVSCVGCHQVHGTEGKHAMLYESQPDLCFSCHENIKSLFYLPSFHPLKEGMLVCSNCHDLHNDYLAYVQEGETTGDMCLSCHMEYQGPFIFEHSPVVEDCMICHNPHGSVVNNLLRQNEPFLC